MFRAVILRYSEQREDGVRTVYVDQSSVGQPSGDEIDLLQGYQPPAQAMLHIDESLGASGFGVALRFRLRVFVIAVYPAIPDLVVRACYLPSSRSRAHWLLFRL